MAGKVKRLIFVSMLACSVIIGCRGDSRELARVKAELEEAKKNLAQITARYNNLSIEKRELTYANNQLQEQIQKLSTDRDNAMDTSQQVSESASSVVNELTARIVLLQNEITELNSIIEEQEATITEQEATISELTNSNSQPAYQGQGQVYQDLGYTN